MNTVVLKMSILVFLVHGSVYSAGSNQDGQLGLGHCDKSTYFHLLRPFCDWTPIKMLSAGCNTSAALTGLNNDDIISFSARKDDLGICKVYVRMCVGRGWEAVHVGGQLCGSDCFWGRGICCRTQRGPRWRSSHMGVLWV